MVLSPLTNTYHFRDPEPVHKKLRDAFLIRFNTYMEFQYVGTLSMKKLIRIRFPPLDINHFDHTWMFPSTFWIIHHMIFIGFMKNHKYFKPSSRALTRKGQFSFVYTTNSLDMPLGIIQDLCPFICILVTPKKTSKALFKDIISLQVLEEHDSRLLTKRRWEVTTKLEIVTPHHRIGHHSTKSIYYNKKRRDDNEHPCWNTLYVLKKGKGQPLIIIAKDTFWMHPII